MDEFVALKAFTKSGVDFEFGEKKFTMKPLVPKKLQRLVKLVESSGKKMENFKTLSDAVSFFLEKVVDIFPIIFDADITQDFANDYISVPLCVEIWEHFVKLNRLEGILPFFQKVIKITKEEEVPIKEKKKK